MLRDLLVLVGSGGQAEAVGDFAIQIAAPWLARVSVFGVPRDPGQLMYLAQAPAKALAEALRQAQLDAEASAKRVRDRAELAAVDCSHHVIVAPAQDVPAVVSRLARRFDLCVMSLPSPESGSDDGKLFEAALLGGGRPVLGVPNGATGLSAPSRVLIAWDGTREASRAVADALPFLRRASLVEIVCVGGATEAVDQDYPGCDVASHLSRHGIACEFLRLPATAVVASQLLNRAGEMQADMIVMGGYHHSQWREAILGGTTRAMSRASKIPILMSR